MKVLVVAEHLNGKLEDITFEMLGKAKELGTAEVALLGHNAKDLAAQLGKADYVVYMDSPELAEFNPYTYGKALKTIVDARQPDIVLIGNTSMGMDLAAALSVDAGMPLVAYAIDVAADKVVSSLYGGKMNVESAVGTPFIASVLAGAFPADAGRGEGSPAVEDLAAPDFGSVKVRFKQLIEPEGGDVDITQQPVLVSVGRGIQNEDNLPMAEELAGKLGGAVSASRPIIDNKWLPKTRQVGKSGLKVKPKLYLTLGISGAPEHIEGMKDAELIIAVNTDPKAPIFDYAHYGTTVDLFDLVPALTAKL